MALNMLQPYRKNHVTCLSLLSELTEGTSRTPAVNRTMPTSANGMFFFIWFLKLFSLLICSILKDARTPLPIQLGSPDPDYFRVSGRVKPASSRWKEDWEELELLVSLSRVFSFSATFIDDVSCREKEPLGRSLKLVTRLTRGYTQVSVISAILFSCLNESTSGKDSSQNNAERHQNPQRS